MNNAELIKALRCCVTDYNSIQSRSCHKCPYAKYADGRYGCENELKADAADAIERLIAEIDRKDKALQDWAKTWEQREDNAIRHICDHCDTPIEVRLKEGACEDCPIKIVVKEIFDEQQP